MTKIVIGLGSFSYLSHAGIGKEGVPTSRDDMDKMLEGKISDFREKSGTEIDCLVLANTMMALKFNNSKFDFDSWISKRELKYMDGDEEFVLYPQCWKGVEMMNSGVFEFDKCLVCETGLASSDQHRMPNGNWHPECRILEQEDPCPTHVAPSMEDILLGKGLDRDILEIGSGRCKHISITNGVTKIVEFDNSDLFVILDEIKQIQEQLDWWYSWGGWLDWLKYLMYGDDMEGQINRIIVKAVGWMKSKLCWTDETWDGALIFATAKFREYPKIDKIWTLTDLEETNAEYISAMESSKYLAEKGQYSEITGHELVGTIGYGNMSSQCRCIVREERVSPQIRDVSYQPSKCFTSQFGLKQLMATIGVHDVYSGNTKHTFVSVDDFDEAINRGYSEIPKMVE